MTTRDQLESSLEIFDRRRAEAAAISEVIVARWTQPDLQAQLTTGRRRFLFRSSRAS